MFPMETASFVINANVALKRDNRNFLNAKNMRFAETSSQAPTSRDNDVVNNTTSKQVLPIILSLLLWTSSANSALAGPAANSNPSIYQGDYADPFHPYCERHISVSSDGQSFHYSGTAVGPKNDPVLRGCSDKEQELYGSRKGAFDGFILDNGGKVSAGDGIHEGFWEPAGVKKAAQKYGDVDGIRWDDGNKWVKLSSPSEVLTFPETYQSKNAMNPILEDGTKWAFVAYVVFSLAAGAVEMAKRFQTWSSNK